jgi:hypothetical protein
MTRSTLLLPGLLACACVGFAAARGSSAGSPITINSCGAELESGSSKGPSIGGIPLSTTSSGIKIEFVNESAKTADLVNFDVNSNGTHFVIRDVGTFSPGISIVHKYRNGSGQSFVLPSFIAPKIKCHVASVRFADGTSWTRGQAPVGVTQPAPTGSTTLSANPTHVNLMRTTESNLFLVSSTERVTAFKETDNCSGIANVFVAATGESSVTYSVKPLSSGSCSAHITDEAGNTLSVPITIH